MRLPNPGELSKSRIGSATSVAIGEVAAFDQLAIDVTRYPMRKCESVCLQSHLLTCKVRSVRAGHSGGSYEVGRSTPRKCFTATERAL